MRRLLFIFLFIPSFCFGQLAVTMDSTNVTCNGDCDGQAIALASGGTPPYDYLWSNASTNDTISNLCPGTYTVTVIDAVPDTLIDSVVITEPPKILPNTSVTSNYNGAKISCYGYCDGEAISNTTGGTPPYTYIWSNALTTQTTTGLCSGIYGVTITDANNCAKDSIVSITNPTPIYITPGVTSNYNGADISCFGACDGEAVTNAQGGTPPYVYTWEIPLGTNDTANGLCSGTYYSVTVTDANGCPQQEDSVILTEPTVVAGTISSIAAINGCDGSATVAPTGGTPGYTYVWDINQFTPTADSLCAGNYCVTVTDTNNCTWDTCVDVLVGIYEYRDRSQFTIYPNPTTGQFTVSSRQGATGEIQVYDLFGRKVLESKEPEIDMSTYPAGLYIWRVGEARGKLVIE